MFLNGIGSDFTLSF